MQLSLVPPINTINTRDRCRQFRDRFFCFSTCLTQASTQRRKPPALLEYSWRGQKGTVGTQKVWAVSTCTQSLGNTHRYLPQPTPVPILLRPSSVVRFIGLRHREMSSLTYVLEMGDSSWPAASLWLTQLLAFPQWIAGHMTAKWKRLTDAQNWFTVRKSRMTKTPNSEPCAVAANQTTYCWTWLVLVIS